MWHPLHVVAKSRFLNLDKLTDFAGRPENWKKYGLVSAGQGLEVSTWNLDNLVSDFRASLGTEQAQADRAFAISEQRRAVVV